jgi:hypothetical protein
VVCPRQAMTVKIKVLLYGVAFIINGPVLLPLLIEDTGMVAHDVSNEVLLLLIIKLFILLI